MSKIYRTTRFEREAKRRIGDAHWKILTAVSKRQLMSHGPAVTEASRPQARGA